MSCTYDLPDYTITAAMVLTIVYAALTIKAVKHGKGKHSTSSSKEAIQFINMYSWYGQHLLFSAMAFVKTSVCPLVTRITDSKRMKRFTGVVILVLAASALECSVVLLAQCRPVSAFWKPGTGTCWPAEIRIYSIYVQAGMLYLHSSYHSPLTSFKAVSIATDLICSLLPIVIMWNLQLPLRTKVSVSAPMAVGLMCTACSGVRARSPNSKTKDIACKF